MSLSTCFFFSSRGRKVTAFGVLFNFKGNDKNTTVQNVEDMVKESWVCHCFILKTVRHGTLQTVFGCYQRGTWFLLARWVSISEYGKQKFMLIVSKGICQLPVTTVSFKFIRREIFLISRRFSGPYVFNVIRAVHPNTPILIFGGHTHIRDCRKYLFFESCHDLS